MALFRIKELLKDRQKPLCVPPGMKVRDALTLMIKHDFTQLPVVDGAERLVGMVTEGGILRRCYHGNYTDILDDLTVDQCRVSAVPLSPELDLSAALKRLEHENAIVVVDDEIPIGILTHYDTTRFLQELSRGLMLVQDIEVTLRNLIEAVLSNATKRDAALAKAFGLDRKNPKRPSKEYDDLTLHDYVQLIITEDNWAKFEATFAPKHLFTTLMESACPIRNKLLHFRGQLTEIDADALECALAFLRSCHRVSADRPAILVSLEIREPDYEPPDDFDMDEYVTSDLIRCLDIASEGASRVRVKMHDVLNSIERRAPGYLDEYTPIDSPSFWLGSGDKSSQFMPSTSQWQVESVDWDSHEVTFHRSITSSKDRK